jgi:RsiW-degrading membrane proteinase PrsW (M82 family)
VGLIYWVDRYEKEPWWLLSAAFVWGAIPAALLAIISNAVLSAPFYILTDNASADLVSGGFIAPFVEEIAKGLALFAILFFWRQELDSPLDGIIYGAMVGMGFAMVENVLYYQAAFIEDGQTGWNMVVLIRGVLFGLSHALYTAMTGLGIAVARLSANRAVRILAPLAGLSLAIFLHAFHNLAMFSGTTLGFLAGLSFDWGGLILTAVIIVLALHQERRWMKKYLQEEVGRGTLSPAEYDLIGSAFRRSRFRLDRLRTGGFSAYRLSGRRFHHCSELAYRKHHFSIFNDDQSREAIKALRKALAAESSQLTI